MCRQENLVALGDVELVARYLEDGDQSAATMLYVRHNLALVRYVGSIVRDPDGAQDIAQETWIYVLHWAGMRVQGGFRTLLLKVGHTKALAWIHNRNSKLRIAAQFAAAGGRFPGILWCRYCDTKAKQHGLCDAHYRRQLRGATEEDMWKPVQRQGARRPLRSTA